MNDHEFAQLARDVFESIGGFVITDMDGNIVYIDERWGRMFGGGNPESCIGRPVEDVLPYTKMKVLADRLKRGEKVSRETELSSNGDTIRNRMIVYRDGKRSAGAVGVTAFNIVDSQKGQSEVLRALERIQLQNELYQEHLAELYTADRDPDDILGDSILIRNVKSLIAKVAPANATVCILGETGTGKELVANAVHKLSRRAEKPFVKINCAAIPKDLMESELFGYEPGAFTGASQRGKMGRFELADGGTLLLDEIGELPLSLQAKLLRVLQSKEVERVGGTKAIPVDVRLICSTNRNLRKMVEEGQFRADLYYRINTMEITVPALRERRGDIPALAARFVEEANRKNGLAVVGLSKGALGFLVTYDWPGNVRELENAIERACIMCGEGELNIRHFAGLKKAGQEKEPEIFDPSFWRRGNVHHPDAGQNEEFTRLGTESLLRDENREKNKILQAMRACQGNHTAAAKRLGIARSTLYLKMKKYGLE